MIKNYVPLRDAKKIHVVELTHLFGENKLVTRHRIKGESSGEILASYADKDSSWLSDEFDAIEGILCYNTNNDTVKVVIGNSVVALPADKLYRHLVAVEIVDVED